MQIIVRFYQKKIDISIYPILAYLLSIILTI